MRLHTSGKQFGLWHGATRTGARKWNRMASSFAVRLVGHFLTTTGSMRRTSCFLPALTRQTRLLEWSATARPDWQT
eukprot:8445718-Lingulodinium_polyedra.AAC.1